MKNNGYGTSTMWHANKVRASSSKCPTLTSFGRLAISNSPSPKRAFVQFGDFYLDPASNPLKTPSGKVEIFSDTIASYNYADCPGHATWLSPQEWLGGERAKQFPLHMISNQPAGKLHSQMDGAKTSQDTKINGREPVEMNVADAASRGIKDGDIVRVFNDRGALLACAMVSERVRESVIRLSTGAWYDPVTPGEPGALEKHGNPNVLTPDRGTSRLAQGPIAHSALVEIGLYTQAAPEVTAYALPQFVTA